MNGQNQHRMQKLEHVLVVEDDPICLILLKILLEDLAITERISSVKHGREALEYLSHLRRAGVQYPNLIFLDLNMPVLNGFEFLEECEQTGCLHGKNTKVVVLTSSGDRKDLARAKELGVTTYLVKPITTEGILQAIREQDFGQA